MNANQWVKTTFAKCNSYGEIRCLSYGFLIRLIALSYSIFHDSYIDHIKYTDIDYHVFTNGSRALVTHKSPYDDKEYRYPPVVALIFVPNILLNQHFGKLLLIIADILCGYFLFYLNLRQGTSGSRSKLYLALWLFNPVTIAISTRGSFEPIITLLALTTLHLLTNENYLLAGLFYGLSIHVKLYPIIYAISYYGFMTKVKTFKPNENKLYQRAKILFVPNINQWIFFIAAMLSLLISCSLSYSYYGEDYLEQSFIYHLKRKDLQHNFSIYFYLFRLFPNYQDQISASAFVPQLVGVLAITLYYISLDSDHSVKLKKLNFSLFGATFLFVSLNKICTSQYFNWYLIYLPLILESQQSKHKQVYLLPLLWLLSQANWLFFAYLYEYQKFDVIHEVGNSSIMFLISNLWILATLCKNFNASLVRVKRD